MAQAPKINDMGSRRRPLSEAVNELPARENHD